jgi:hypothetical protein
LRLLKESSVPQGGIVGPIVVLRYGEDGWVEAHGTGIQDLSDERMVETVSVPPFMSHTCTLLRTTVIREVVTVELDVILSSGGHPLAAEPIA